MSNVENKWKVKLAKDVPNAGISQSAEHTKYFAKKGVEAGSVGSSVAQYVLNTPGYLALTVGGAAASATGIGLIVTGAAATLTLSTLSAVSANKSRKHAGALSTIVDRHECYRCAQVDGNKSLREEHMHIALDVGPYIIHQKEEKTVRKAIGTVPGISLLGTVYTLGRAAYKSARGNKGKTRSENASALAMHLLTHNCGLAQAIVAQLYSFETMCWLLTQEHETVTKALAKKMAST